MIRVGIVGCGKIADQHAEEIRKLQGCKMVGVCDREGLMARQLAERFDVERHFTQVQDLIEKARPDVVHIITPPQSHHGLAKLCLEADCHIYVEKPFTLNATEAEDLIGLAIRRDLKLTVGHNAQFTHAANRMRQLVAEGYLGGAPVHMESYYCYNLSDPTYAKAVLGDSSHWVRRLPGKLLHNVISHGISKLAEFLQSESPRVIAHGFASPLLREIGESEIIDELRVIIKDENAATAYFTFSSQMRPVLHQLRLYGPQNGLIVDDDHQTVIKLTGSRHKSYLEQFVPPWVFAKQYLSNSASNIKKFLKADFHEGYGMKFLIESFYRSVADGTALPIPYREIMLTARIMDEIFAQVHGLRDAEGGEYNQSPKLEAVT